MGLEMGNNLKLHFKPKLSVPLRGLEQTQMNKFHLNMKFKSKLSSRAGASWSSCPPLCHPGRGRSASRGGPTQRPPA